MFQTNRAARQYVKILGFSIITQFFCSADSIDWKALWRLWNYCVLSRRERACIASNEIKTAEKNRSDAFNSAIER